MDNFERMFQHYPQFRIAICRQCQFAPVPGEIQKHLRKHHTRLSTKEREEISEKFRTLSDLARHETEVIYPTSRDAPIAELPVFFDAITCTAQYEDNSQCHYVCRTARGIREHCKDKHRWTNNQKRGGDVRQKRPHAPNKLWRCNRACQMFFKSGSWKRHFEVAAVRNRVVESHQSDPKSNFFRQQEDEMRKIEQGSKDAASRVAGFEDHRSSVLPWLRTTGIVDHVYRLKKDEIRAATSLPSTDETGVLPVILEGMDGLLQQAHSWCFDGPECMLTWPCRVVLAKRQRRGSVFPSLT